MGFWSTVLVALGFQSGEIPVVTEPLHLFKLRLDARGAHGVIAETTADYRLTNDVLSVQRVRLEAR